jgi:hypothetical protein
MERSRTILSLPRTLPFYFLPTRMSERRGCVCAGGNRREAQAAGERGKKSACGIIKMWYLRKVVCILPLGAFTNDTVLGNKKMATSNTRKRSGKKVAVEGNMREHQGSGVKIRPSEKPTDSHFK